MHSALILHKHSVQLALLRARELAPAGKFSCSLVHILGFLALIAAPPLLLLFHHLPNGFAAALLVHITEFIAALLQGSTLPAAVQGQKEFSIYGVVSAAFPSLLEIPLAGAELAALHLLLALLLPPLVVFIIYGGGGDSGGVSVGRSQ